MKKLKIIHCWKSMFQGGLYFVLDNRMMHFEFINPAFNDYNEIRLSLDFYSMEQYNLDENDSKLYVDDSFIDYEISDNLFNVFNKISKHLSDEDYDNNYNLAESIKNEYNMSIFFEISGVVYSDIGLEFYKHDELASHDDGIHSFEQPNKSLIYNDLKKDDIHFTDEYSNLLIDIYKRYTEYYYKK